MKAANPALIALLDSGQDFEMADLWTITLKGGAVVRWSGADADLTANGHEFVLGPVISRSSITERIGLDVDTLQVTIAADGADLINDTPIIPFILKHGFDGANVRLDRAFLPSWDDPVTGTILRFAGRVTSIDEIKGSTAQLTISSWAVLLNVNMPTNLYQVPCLHSVYDAGCKLNAAAFAVSGTVTAIGDAATFTTSLSVAAGDLAQGRIVFASGANAGVSATIKANDGSGSITLIRPLPAPLGVGDAFTAYPGCDLTRGRCQTRFNNLQNYKAAPFTPVPETVF